MTSLTLPRALFAVLFAVVTFLTLTPNPADVEPGFAVTRWIARIFFGDAALADKVAHFLAYATLGLTASWARLRLLGTRWGIGVGLALYGIALEGLQGLGGVRDPELADALANGLGALAGLSAGYAMAAMMARKRAS